MIARSTTSGAKPPGARRAFPGASLCTLATWWLVGLVGAGCGGGARGALQPRTTDLAALQREAAADPAAVEPWYQMALVHAAQQRHDDAMRALHTALRRHGDYEPALTLMAKLFFESGRSVEGVQYFSTRALNTWSEPVRINVGLLLADAGRFDEARMLLGDAQHGPHAAAARANLAYLDWIEGDLESAGREFEALDRTLATPAARHNAALGQLVRGDAEGSAARLQGVADEHLELRAARVNLALVLRHWLFDDARAAALEAESLALAPPQLSAALVHELLRTGVVEDAAPKHPEPPPANETQHPEPEARDDASSH